MRGKTVRRIFISHSTVESELASCLAEWLERRFPGVECFCGGRPRDLVPGAKWFEEIKEKARSSYLCLSLISPDSANNPWIQFESGLIVGSGEEKLLVPALYGGLDIGDVPGTMRGFQCLRLDRQESMDAFVAERILAGRRPRPPQRQSNFIEQLPPRVRRLMAFGEFGLLVSRPTQTFKLLPTVLDGNKPVVDIKRTTEEGELVALRVKVVPRRLGPTNHWKFGVTLMQESTPESCRYFQFHNGCHLGFTSWTIYVSKDHQVPVNVPATLHLERPSTLQLWLSEDGRFAGCVGIDSTGERRVIRSDTGEDTWRLKFDGWEKVRLGAWADGAPFRVDIESLEVDRLMAGNEDEHLKEGSP